MLRMSQWTAVTKQWVSFQCTGYAGPLPNECGTRCSSKCTAARRSQPAEHAHRASATKQQLSGTLPVPSLHSTQPQLVAVVRGLIGAAHRHVNIRGLVRSQRRQPCPQLGQVQRRHFLIQVLGQHVHFVLVPPRALLLPELQLGNDLRSRSSGRSDSSGG
jgi:hypothetical protein